MSNNQLGARDDPSLLCPEELHGALDKLESALGDLDTLGLRLIAARLSHVIEDIKVLTNA